MLKVGEFIPPCHIRLYDIVPDEEQRQFDVYAKILIRFSLYEFRQEQAR
jgi:hypothetical protein